MSKKVVQQSHSDFGARGVFFPVRELSKIARTPLAAFFNILFILNPQQQT